MLVNFQRNVIKNVYFTASGEFVSIEIDNPSVVTQEFGKLSILYGPGQLSVVAS